MVGGRGKDKMVAGLLSIFLGAFGVHHFYLGSTMAGVICIALTVFTCGSLGSIVGLVEGIMILMMSDTDFDTRYNARTPESMEFVFMPPK